MNERNGQGRSGGGDYQDPGWLAAFGRMGAGLLRSRGAETDGILVLRLLFLALLSSGFLILYVLVFLMEQIGTPDAALGSIVVILGLGGIAAAAWTSRRALDVSDAAALAQSYRVNFFLGFALNQSPLLLSFVFCFLTNELWPYLVDLPLYLVGMALIAPTRGNLARRQEDIQRQGSMLSLGHALAVLPPQPRR